MPAQDATSTQRIDRTPIVLFDGDCGLCAGWVRFVLRNEVEPTLAFASLQSRLGRALLSVPAGAPPSLDSIVYVDAAKTRAEKSDAVVRILAHLRQPLPVFGLVLRCVPRRMRDAVYDAVARRRRAWFGGGAACRLPSPEERARFLDVETSA